MRYTLYTYRYIVRIITLYVILNCDLLINTYHLNTFVRVLINY